MRTKYDLELMQFAQQALVDEVASLFRAVSFQLSPDGEPCEDTLEVVNVIMGNIFANYSKNHRFYSEDLLSVPYPEQMEHLPLLVFMRNEDDWNSWTKEYGNT